MTLWVAAYLLTGIAIGTWAAWEIAKDEATQRDPSPLATVAMFAFGVLVWPLIVAIVIVGSIGAYVTERAGGDS